jgi:outer membrane protein OmpA-like peptidoglycan-associated protein
MQSRQIQVFGLIGSVVLILFIVIFLGKDFHQLYLKYGGENLIPSFHDEQVVMEADVVKNLTERLNRESSQVLENIQEKENASPEKSVSKRVVESSIVSKADTIEKAVKLPAAIQNGSVAAVQDISASENKLSAEEEIKILNKEISMLLQQVPFFKFSMALTPKNKKVLDQIALKLSSSGFAYSITVEGHTEAGVSARSSETMALRVARYLKEKIPGITVETVGYGNMYPIIDDPYNTENRRVEIIVRRSSE